MALIHLVGGVTNYHHGFTGVPPGSRHVVTARSFDSNMLGDRWRVAALDWVRVEEEQEFSPLHSRSTSTLWFIC